MSKVLRIDDMEQLRKDIDEDPIIKDSMADIGATISKYFWKAVATYFDCMSYGKSHTRIYDH